MCAARAAALSHVSTQLAEIAKDPGASDIQQRVRSALLGALDRPTLVQAIFRDDRSLAESITALIAQVNDQARQVNAFAIPIVRGRMRATETALTPLRDAMDLLNLARPLIGSQQDSASQCLDTANKTHNTVWLLMATHTLSDASERDADYNVNYLTAARDALQRVLDTISNTGVDSTYVTLAQETLAQAQAQIQALPPSAAAADAPAAPPRTITQLLDRVAAVSPNRCAAMFNISQRTATIAVGALGVAVTLLRTPEVRAWLFSYFAQEKQA